MPFQLPVSPVSGLIDDSNVLTLSWPLVQETAGSPGFPFGDFAGWDIYTSQTNGPGVFLQTFSPIPASPSAGQTLTYTTVLATGAWFLNMRAHSTGAVDNGPTWSFNGSLISPLIPPTAGLGFPDPIATVDVVFTVGGTPATSMLLGQPLTVTLQPAYTNADQWQIQWPDNTTSGWLPLSASVVVKQFQISGALNVVIQTRKQYNSIAYNPPVVLMRQLTVQIFVVDQQFSSTTAAAAALTGTLGIGGQQGFEIVDATTGTVTPNPWEVIARAIVRDTVTNELKLLVATSRFADASSLLGTGAFDVFPIAGRPKTKELIIPVYENTFNSATSAVPVKITTSSLPSNIFVGKSMAEFQLTASGGTLPYIWFTDGLPAGLKLSVNGILSGTPQALGTTSINVAAQDASVPFYVSEVALPITITTDLLVEIAAGQTDANNTALPQLGNTFGVAQVNKPYSVQMLVGNVDPTSPLAGGLPPYTWSTPAGSLPIGLSIDPSTGIISGSPCTYNSTTDFSRAFSIVVQVTDAVGAKATHTYSMTLVPAALEFGNLNQPVIYAEQQFKLAIPIFGGKSPYSLTAVGGDGFFPAAGQTGFYGPATVDDGQLEVEVNYPTAGSFTFVVVISDNTTPTPTQTTKQFTVTVQPALSDAFLIPGLVDHVWGNPDTAYATPFPITGVFSGFALGGVKIDLTQSAGVSAGTTVYTGTITGGAGSAYAGTKFVVSGFQTAANNGTFVCTASSASTLTLSNTVGVAENLFPIVYSLTSVANAVPGSSNSPTEPFISTTTYTGTITGGGSNAYVGQRFAVTGFTGSNNGTFYCVGSTETTLVLNNPSGFADTAAATATQSVAKALWFGLSTPSVAVPYSYGTTLSNGVTVVIDPVIPEVEVVGTLAGSSDPRVAGAAQFIVPIQLQRNISNTPTTVATFSQAYQILSENNAPPTWAAGDIGAVQVTTRPYIVGELVGLNPREPYVNSSDVHGSDVPSITPAVTITGIAEDSGSVVTLTVDANPFITGQQVVLSGLSVGTWLNGALVTLTSPTNSTTLTFDDPTLHGTQTFVVETGIASPPDAPWKAVVQINSALPLGLSLDTNTGIMYGTIVGTFANPSVVEFIGTSGMVHGIVTIIWNTVVSSFPLIDNIQDGVLTNTSYPSTSKITVPTGVTPTSAAIFFGRLPAGLTLSPTPTGQDFNITGSSTEGGYFDIWFQVVGSSGIAYLYHRFSISFIEPLIIATSSLPTASAQAYFAQLQGFGGEPPYTWSSLNFPSEAGAGGFAGLTLHTSTGVIDGTLSSPPVSSPTDLGDIQVTLTDSRGTAVTDGTGYQPTLDLVYNNGLRIVTPTPNGVATVFQPDPLGGGYSFQMQAAGGIPPYQWEISPTSPLPSGITPISGNPWNGSFVLQTSGGGLFGGTKDGTPYLPNPTLISITLKDSTATTVTESFNIFTSTSAAPIGIDSTGIGTIPRGEPYHGSLAVTGPFVLPVAWYVAPDSVHANALPAGLVLQADGSGSTAGATATISGTYSGAPLTNYQVRIIAVDNTVTDGQTAEAVVTFNTTTNLVITGWDTVPPTNFPNGFPFPLPNAVVTGSYGPIQLIASHGVPVGTNTDGYPRYVWSSSPASPYLGGIALAGSGSNSGQLSGTATVASSVPIIFTVSDSLSPANQASLTTTLTSQASGLTITTLALPNATAGVPYSLQLTAAGSPNTPYTFSVASGSLPSGFTLSPAGLITGTTLQVGFSQVITFRVTDSIGAYFNKPLNLTVVSGLALKTGIDFVDGISNNYLGFVDVGNVASISPRPQLSFFVVATNVVSTSPSQIAVVVSGGFSGSVTNLNTTAHTAQIQLTGPFSGGVAGDNSLTISVTDSGVTAIASFKWFIYTDGSLRLAPSSGSIPLKLTTST